ncbi:MAG: hypothetical protein DRQ55_11160 [Planctomycetota bacterium]|nr:MAG: hypothetical protein DRQ55_11160 [Planctomycetota bacterium]RKZ10670.1 MAG: hypothetical protein DRQ32_06935 [bacterium]
MDKLTRREALLAGVAGCVVGALPPVRRFGSGRGVLTASPGTAARTPLSWDHFVVTDAGTFRLLAPQALSQLAADHGYVHHSLRVDVWSSSSTATVRPCCAHHRGLIAGDLSGVALYIAGEVQVARRTEIAAQLLTAPGEVACATFGLDGTTLDALSKLYRPGFDSVYPPSSRAGLT